MLSALEATAGAALRMAASLAFLAVLWWPFFLAAIVGAWLFFEKAGRPGWACLVPGYNAFAFFRIARLPGWLSLLLLVPGVNVLLYAAACVRVARAFRKGPRFAAGLVLLPPVFLANLGLGAARYRRFEVVEGASGRSGSEPAGFNGARPAAGSPCEPVALGVAAGGGGGRGGGALRLVVVGASASAESAGDCAARPLRSVDLG